VLSSISNRQCCAVCIVSLQFKQQLRQAKLSTWCCVQNHCFKKHTLQSMCNMVGWQKVTAAHEVWRVLYASGRDSRTHIHTHAHTQTHTHTHARTHTHTHSHVYIYTHTHTHARTQTNTPMHPFTHSQTWWTHTPLHTHRDTKTHVLTEQNRRADWGAGTWQSFEGCEGLC